MTIARIFTTLGFIFLIMSITLTALNGLDSWVSTMLIPTILAIYLFASAWMSRHFAMRMARLRNKLIDVYRAGEIRKTGKGTYVVELIQEWIPKSHLLERIEQHRQELDEEMTDKSSD